MVQPKEQIVRRNISLWEFDNSVVTRLAEQKGLDFSSAIRVIIREWASDTPCVQAGKENQAVKRLETK